MKPVEVVFVKTKEVSCSGARDSSPHPLVYLNIGDKDGVVCPYCSKYFTVKNKDSYRTNFLKKS
jgi:uncharacterized Zn-finger protein